MPLLKQSPQARRPVDPETEVDAYAILFVLQEGSKTPKSLEQSLNITYRRVRNAGQALQRRGYIRKLGGKWDTTFKGVGAFDAASAERAAKCSGAPVLVPLPVVAYLVLEATHAVPRADTQGFEWNSHLQRWVRYDEDGTLCVRTNAVMVKLGCADYEWDAHRVFATQEAAETYVKAAPGGTYSVVSCPVDPSCGWVAP